MSTRAIHVALLTHAGCRRLLLMVLVAGAALAAAAAQAAAPASAATSEDYFFISSIGPTYAPSLSFSTGGAGPNGVCTDTVGNVYVSLPSGFAKFDASGAHVVTYTGDNGYSPFGYGIDVDRDGNVYFADRGNHCVSTLVPNTGDVDGTSYAWASITGKAGGGGDANIGTGNGEFNFPSDVAVGGGYLYVAELLNHRVQKFAIDPDTHQLAWVATWGKAGGGSGSGDGEFNRPRGVDAYAGSNGHVLVVEESNQRLQEFTSAGVFVSKFGSPTPSDPLYLSGPTGVAVDVAGDAYVTDSGAHWVGKFRKSDGVWTRVTRLGSFGTGDAQFDFPWAGAVDPDGYLYVTDTFNNKLKRFARDATAPTVTPAGFPTGWTKVIAHPELLGSDPAVTGQYTSGGVSIRYSMTGGAPWNNYYGPFAAMNFVEGDNAITYFGRDAVGNESAPATIHLYYDKTVPVTAASGMAAGWSRSDQTLTLTPAHDGFSPIASTQYRIQGAPTWDTYSGPIVVSAEGTSVYEYRSTDAAGNAETAKTTTVRVDRTRPAPKALKNVTVKRNATVKLPYRIGDVPGAGAKVTIRIYKGSKLKKRLTVGTKAANVSLRFAYRCRLPKGRYHWRVYATDLAGNTQVKPAVRTLTVK